VTARQPDPAGYVVGVDFGTLSGRALVVRVADGAELGSAVHPYRHAVIADALPGRAMPLPPDWALQVPSDYVDVLKTAVPEAVRSAGIDPSHVVGIGTDFTACTMVPALADSTPLCELPRFADRPHAYAKLWRHHSAQGQADRINRLAVERGEKWLARYGGSISSEWEFAKALQILEEDPEIYAATECWVEAADWIVWQLSGRYLRNICSAGYKGILQDGHYPNRDFLVALNPEFGDFVETKLAHEIGKLGELAGRLTPRASMWTGLPEGIAVAVGNVDAHVTAAAADALAPGRLVAIMGTSTCHVMNGTELREVPGMCGVVLGGISAGAYGYEAGQSGVGDIFSHYLQTVNGVTHEELTDRAASRPVGAHGLVALDWHSGNRSVLVNHELSGLLVGETLATKPEDVYRALLEATAFGTRMIVEAFTSAGVPVDEFVVAGGLRRNRLLLQIYADVLGMPLSVIRSEQGPALGSAIHAAVAGRAYPDVPAAAAAMGGRDRDVYRPIPQNAAVYDQLFAEYTRLHDYFGRGGNEVMRRLRRIQRDALVREMGP
jgi:L-ribulokinase